MPSAVLPFKKTIAALAEDSEERLVPFDGSLSQVIMHFPDGTDSLLDVRLLYMEEGMKRCVIPSVDDTYIALNDATPSFTMSFSVKKNGKLRVEYKNYDSANPHTISVQATVSPPVGGE